MKDDRLRVPVDDAYLVTLGRATYCFARLEWIAVYCGEKLSAGYLTAVASKRKTAGAISRDIGKLAERIADAKTRKRYQAAVDEFDRLVYRRNDLMHAKPAKVGHDERLECRGTPWQPNEIEDLADEFAACEDKLNELFHHIL